MRNVYIYTHETVQNFKTVQFYRDLQMLQDRQYRKCLRLEQQCQEEELGHCQEIAQLQEKNKVLILCLRSNSFYLQTLCTFILK